MLYQIYEAQRAISEPFADFAKASSKLFSNPLWAMSETPLAQRIAAGYDLLYRLGKDYVKPTFDIKTADVGGTEVAIHERIDLDLPFCELRRFKRFSDNPATLERMLKHPAVLIVAPLSGHYATLLRETVRTMLAGHKVYITDWKNARMVPLSEGEFHLDDYVNYVQQFIRLLQQKHGNCHVMSVCQPTVPVLAAISLMASRGEKLPRSMVMMGGPIDARKTPTTVNDLAVKRSFEWFENNLIYRVPYGYPGEGRRVYPGFLQYSGFVAMNPDRHASSYYDYFRNLIRGDDDATEFHRKFYDEYNAVLDMDANYYLQTIETVFQKFKLVNGTWDVRNPEGKLERVKPADIRGVGLITVEGELDDISGSGQTEAAHGLCSNIAKGDRAHVEVEGAGHYGIFSGSRWRKVVYPQIRDFILRFEPSQSDAAKAPTTPPKAAQTAPAAAKAPAAVKKTPATAPKAKAASAAKTAAKTTASKTAASKTTAAKTTAPKAAAPQTAAAKEEKPQTAAPEATAQKAATPKAAAAKAATPQPAVQWPSSRAKAEPQAQAEAKPATAAAPAAQSDAKVQEPAPQAPASERKAAEAAPAAATSAPAAASAPQAQAAAAEAQPASAAPAAAKLTDASDKKA
ncbi:polyhydroxyalkanoate depolymerase [Allofranklinella schreckenbergeri]|uniref:Polyhydroxyalkanoate depolymerase n=1 Tax=Allofranklinella schreckenbergeri TaxID=1076744 RepID=A0A3M6PXR7_9BURK|nr:polyhydroxyalkanoate depolymerase [Allofranklinella schreckenbergeri]RMW95526.1 polyhydroxyalkanoate depolymerase [Allofranklinella schreckenbergeri]